MMAGVAMKAGLAAIIGGALMAGLAPAANAQPNTSAYTKMDIEKGCRWQDAQGNAVDPQEIPDGACSVCSGQGNNVVRVCEGDLRQSVAYGQESLLGDGWHSFGQFNSFANTVEWRLSGGKAVAAIQRQLIDNMNDNGAPDPKKRGQVLVISTVARPGHAQSCPVGYVDARANSNANELARQVADQIAPDFQCGTDRPQFHGKRGPLSGNPTGLDQ